MNRHLRRARAAYDLLVARRSTLFDLALAVITTAVELGPLFDDDTPVGIIPVVVTILVGSVLLFRRRAPLTVLITACAGAAVLVPLGYSPGGAPVVVRCGSRSM